MTTYRTLFLGDTHLGSPHCQADRLLKFLRGVYFDNLVLVGDIFDDPGLELPDRHIEILALLLGRIQDGVKTIFVPGNHDAILRGFIGQYGNLSIQLTATYRTATSKKLIIFHGDELDNWGSSRLMHALDRALPVPFWEMLNWIARPLMLRHIKRFEKQAVALVYEDSVALCGHVHFPALGSRYANIGDWIKHCSAIVEHHDGTLELVRG